MKTSMKTRALLVMMMLSPASALAIMEDDPLLTMLKVDQLELRDADEGDVTAWEGHLWIGKDLNKLWIKTEGERSSEATESAEIQLLYSRAVDSNWDLQLGLRHDARPTPNRDWFAIGFNGLAPYFFDVDSAIFIERDGQVNLRFQTEYEIMMTQKWVLSPELEINWFSEDDLALGIGAGFSDLEAGVRLRYEISRDLAPYIGVNFEKLLGDTADIAEAASLETSESQLVLGVSFWF